MSVQLAAYYQRVRLWKPTGVGKHILNMSEAVSRLNGALPSFHAIDDLKNAHHRGILSPAGSPAPMAIPIPRRVLEASWLSLGLPTPGMFGIKPDWIYCPAEYFVATSRRSHLAVTIHCDNWFNAELPWYNDADIAETRRRRWPLYTKIAATADRIFCVSTFLKNRIIELFKVDPERIVVVGNGVETVFFNPLSQHAHASKALDDSPYVVVLGGLTRRKGGDVTLRVARELYRANPKVKVAIVGTSEKHYDLEATSVPNIVSLGYVGVADGLPSLVSNAIALLFLSDYETFGIPAVEAMAAGTPPIVSSKGALPEIVGNAGFVVDSGNESKAVELIDSLTKDSSQRDAYRSTGIVRASQFTWDRCADTLIKALN